MFALSLGCATADAPGLAAFNVSCWRAEPNAPTRPIGGSNETQKVVAFVPPRSDRTDTSFHQSDIRTFSGGGFVSELKPKDNPANLILKPRPEVDTPSAGRIRAQTINRPAIR